MQLFGLDTCAFLVCVAHYHCSDLENHEAPNALGRPNQSEDGLLHYFVRLGAAVEPEFRLRYTS